MGRIFFRFFVFLFVYALLRFSRCTPFLNPKVRLCDVSSFFGEVSLRLDSAASKFFLPPLKLVMPVPSAEHTEVLHFLPFPTLSGIASSTLSFHVVLSALEGLFFWFGVT